MGDTEMGDTIFDMKDMERQIDVPTYTPYLTEYVSDEIWNVCGTVDTIHRQAGTNAARAWLTLYACNTNATNATRF